MSRYLDVIPYENHRDNKETYRAEMITYECMGPKAKVEIWSKMEGNGFFLKLQHKGTWFATAGYMPRLSSARLAAPVFFAQVKLGGGIYA